MASRRRFTVLAAAAALATGALLGTTPATGAAGGHPPGVINSFAIGAHVQLVDYDVATNSAGRAYIGWISTDAQSHRQVNLCTLPVGATACSYRHSTPALDDASADSLKVLVTSDDTVKLVWFHDTSPGSVIGLQGAEIAVASAPHGQNLGAGADMATAPSFGQLLTAEIGPSNQIWTVAYAGLGTTALQVRRGITNDFDSVSLPAGFGVADAELAFTGGKAVLSVTKYGSISDPVRYAVRPATGGWSSFHTVPGTWTGAGSVALETTTHGLRLVTGVNNSSYRPVLAKWTGSAFAPRQLTADSCDVASHDGYADPSGRLLDVSQDCATKLAVTNYPDASHAAVIRFPINGTLTFTPQIASGTRGIATVVWSVLGTTGHILRVTHVRLADATRTVRHSGTGGRVTVTGPVSCLPPVNVHVGWTHKPAANWTFRSGSLRLGNTGISGSTLDGAKLTPGTAYTLVGTATFGRGGSRSTVRASLGFRTCGTG